MVQVAHTKVPMEPLGLLNSLTRSVGVWRVSAHSSRHTLVSTTWIQTFQRDYITKDYNDNIFQIPKYIEKVPLLRNADVT